MSIIYDGYELYDDGVTRLDGDGNELFMIDPVTNNFYYVGSDRQSNSAYGYLMDSHNVIQNEQRDFFNNLNSGFEALPPEIVDLTDWTSYLPDIPNFGQQAIDQIQSEFQQTTEYLSYLFNRLQGEVANTQYGIYFLAWFHEYVERKGNTIQTVIDFLSTGWSEIVQEKLDAIFKKDPCSEWIKQLGNTAEAYEAGYYDIDAQEGFQITPGIIDTKFTDLLRPTATQVTSRYIVNFARSLAAVGIGSIYFTPKNDTGIDLDGILNYDLSNQKLTYGERVTSLLEYPEFPEYDDLTEFGFNYEGMRVQTAYTTDLQQTFTFEPTDMGFQVRRPESVLSPRLPSGINIDYVFPENQVLPEMGLGSITYGVNQGKFELVINRTSSSSTSEQTRKRWDKKSSTKSAKAYRQLLYLVNSTYGTFEEVRDLYDSVVNNTVIDKSIQIDDPVIGRYTYEAGTPIAKINNRHMLQVVESLEMGEAEVLTDWQQVAANVFWNQVQDTMYGVYGKLVRGSVDINPGLHLAVRSINENAYPCLR
jgi:hypothetical protein